MLAGTAEGVMVVIAPAQAKPILAMLLHSPGAVAALPVSALGLEEQLASLVTPHQVEDPVQGLMGGADPFGVAGKHTPACPPEFLCFDDVRQFIALEGSGHEPTVGTALDRFQLCPVFFGHSDAAI